jgi:hypothetical protein
MRRHNITLQRTGAAALRPSAELDSFGTLKRRVSFFLALVTRASVAVPAMHGQEAPRKRRVNVAVYSSGDDGLTLRFRDALEKALGASPVFALSTDRAKDELVMHIPANLRGRDVQGNTITAVAVALTDRHLKYLDTSVLECDDANLPGCAASVLEDARRVWKAHSQSKGSAH